jgi:hypothetical protein
MIDMKKLLLIVVTLALGIASAASTYHFTLQEPANFNGTSLQPGDYKIQLAGDKATLKVGKNVVEAPAKLETAERKYATTTISFNSTGPGKSITEIHVGGTKTRIIIVGAHSAGQ